MGFGDFMKKAGSLAWEGTKRMGEKAMAMSERMNNYLAETDQWDDETLLRRYQNASGERKQAYGYALKQRGYGRR